MRRVDVFAPEFDRFGERERYTWRAARIGQQLGSQRIGVSLYELDDGERSFPYHFHHGMEEWLLVVSGTPVLRGSDGERELRAGDVVCFAPGPEGAHQVRGPGTVLILSANRYPETVEYPDSGKVGLTHPRSVYRAGDAIDYWEGE